MQRRTSALMAMLLLCASTAAVPQSREQRPLWNKPIAPFRIVGNIHYVGTEQLGAYLITGSGGHILIDGAMPESAAQIAGNVRRLGFRVEDIEILLINHAHMDHAGGLAELKRLTGARLLASQGDRPELESGRIAYRDESWPFPGVKVDGLLRDGQQVRVGDTVLTTVATPGHTRGCTSWSMRVREGRRPLDVLFACSLSVAGQPLVGDGRYPAAAADFRRTYAKLRRMRTDVFLNYHGDFFDLSAKRARLAAGDPLAFVDRTELSSQLDRAEKAFAVELAAQRRRVAVQ